MPYFAKLLLLIFCLVLLVESRKHRRRRWTSQLDVQRASHIYKKNHDVTKTWKGKTEQLLRVDDHDFTMRPAFGGRTCILKNMPRSAVKISSNGEFSTLNKLPKMTGKWHWTGLSEYVYEFVQYEVKWE